MDALAGRANLFAAQCCVCDNRARLVVAMAEVVAQWFI